jgi:two-component system, NtrC family, response regulator GlrR
MAEGKGTVLVLDDEPSLRLLCKVNLELEGYRVVEAGTLAEARAAMADEPVDVALLDMHVGAERGLDLLPELRGLEPPAAVVVLSGTSEVSSATRATVDAVLGKPFVLDELTQTVGRALSGSRRAHA